MFVGIVLLSKALALVIRNISFSSSVLELGSPAPLFYSWCSGTVIGVGEEGWPGHSESLRWGEMRLRCCAREQTLWGPGRGVTFTFVSSEPFFLGVSAGLGAWSWLTLACSLELLGLVKVTPPSFADIGTSERKIGEIEGGCYSEPSPRR